MDQFYKTKQNKSLLLVQKIIITELEGAKVNIFNSLFLSYI